MFGTMLRRLEPLATPANLLAALFLAGLLALLGWLRAATAFDPFTADGLGALLDASGWRAPVVYVAIVAIAVVVSQIPGLPLVVAAGAAFELVPALVYGVAGNFLGAMIAYALGRSLGRGVMRSLVGRVVVFRRERGARTIGLLIFASRALPLFPFDLISYAAGVSAVPLRVYAPATLLGLIPSTWMLTVLGSSLNLGLVASLALSAVASVGIVAIAWATRDRDPFGLRATVALEGEGDRR